MFRSTYSNSLRLFKLLSLAYSLSFCLFSSKWHHFQRPHPIPLSIQESQSWWIKSSSNQNSKEVKTLSLKSSSWSIRLLERSLRDLHFSSYGFASLPEKVYSRLARQPYLQWVKQSLQGFWDVLLVIPYANTQTQSTRTQYAEFSLKFLDCLKPH